MGILAILIELLPQLFKRQVFHFARGSAQLLLRAFFKHVAEAKSLEEVYIKAVELLFGFGVRRFFGSRIAALSYFKLHFGRHCWGRPTVCWTKLLLA